MEDKIFSFNYNGKQYYYHSTYEIEKFTVNTDKRGKLKFREKCKCTKCSGTGYVVWKRDNGICYNCHGYGYSFRTIKTAMNRETIERQIKKEEEKKNLRKEKQQEYFNRQLENNKKKTQEDYSDIFYLILDNGKNTTYKYRKELKEKGARWNPVFGCWWSKSNDFKEFKLIPIRTKEVVNEYNVVDEYEVNQIKHKILDMENMEG